MVQITHALIRDDQTGELVKIAADKFDKKTDGKKTCHCPDKKCGAILTHYASHLHTYFDLETGRKPRKVRIPDYFRVAGGNPAHHESCTAVQAYNTYQSYARRIGGLSQQYGSFVYNLNIKTDDYPAPIRPRRVAAPKFEHAVRDEGAPDENSKPEKRVLSVGLNHVQKLAGLLDHTEFDRHYRDAIVLRDGNRHYTLAGLFADDTLSLFREEFTRASLGKDNAPILLQFKPIVIGRYHNKKDLTIQGLAVPMRASDRNDYFVSVKLHCGTKEIYDALKSDIASGKHSFLVYAEKATVDLQECARKRSEVQSRTAKDRSVFVHVHVNMPQQIIAWKPVDGQLDLGLAGLEMPIMPPPFREIPPHLTR